MKKRRHQRIELPNLIANLSDGVDFFSGTVSDVSRTGMSLVNIPPKLNNLGEELSVVVSAKGKNFKMPVMPKWVSGNDSERKMGLAILAPPLDWTVFVMDFEPKFEDIWAETTHLPGF
jgi:hypothetical protein